MFMLAVRFLPKHKVVGEVIMYIEDFITGFRFIYRHKWFSLLRIASLVPGMLGMMIYWIYISSNNVELSGTAIMFTLDTWKNVGIFFLICTGSCLIYSLVCYAGRKLKFSGILTLKIYGKSGKDIFYYVLAESLIILIISILIALTLFDQWMVVSNPLPGWELRVRNVTTAKLFILTFTFFVNCALVISYLHSKIKVTDLMKTNY